MTSELPMLIVPHVHERSFRIQIEMRGIMASPSWRFETTAQPHYEIWEPVDRLETMPRNIELLGIRLAEPLSAQYSW